MRMNRNKTGRLQPVIVLVLLLALLWDRPVYAAQTLSLSIPFFQVFHNDSSLGDVDDLFWYQITAKDDAPLPLGSDDERYLWSVEGNTSGELSLDFPIESAGIYYYEISAYVTEPVEGYTYEQRIFWLMLQVEQENDVLEVLAVTIEEDGGDAKLAEIPLDPAYRNGTIHGDPGEDPAPTPEKELTPAPIKTPVPTPPQTLTPTPTETLQDGGTDTTETGTAQSYDSSSAESPKTGDETSVFGRITACLLSLCCIGMLLGRKKDIFWRFL